MSDFIDSIVRRRMDRPAVSSDRPEARVTKALATTEIVVQAYEQNRQYCALLEKSGLFDQAFYLEAYPDTAASELSPLEHFFGFGYREGRCPNPFFNPTWYLASYPDVDEAGMQPLLHYVLHGEAQGRRPSPIFDTNWYRARHGLGEGTGVLAHYLANRRKRPISPMPDFDADYYAANNPDVAAAKIDLFEHFLYQGHKEGRNPSAAFDVRYYAQRHMHGDSSQNPFLHYLAHRNDRGVAGRMPDDESTISREIRRTARPGPYFEERRPLAPGITPQVLALAYYLPQFHAFKENDAWWGDGFTEWTNLVRGSPRFAGHYQPRVPRDLGFYRLDTIEPMRTQVKFAREAGIGGFVFYYYWFNGKRLMAGPVDRFLADPTVEMPFALMWANENWTRRWDGADTEVLISQDYHAADDHAMAAEFVRHFRDPRYIRLDGRPLLMVYRPGIIPNTKSTLARWRALFQEKFGEDPIFVMAQAFGDTDPALFGFDGAIEFPPHKLTTTMQPANPAYSYLDADFTGKIYRYEDVVETSLAEAAPSYQLIRTACPSWDNDARRQGAGLVVTGSTPAKYESWMAALVKEAIARPFFGQPIVCVNAWNEWCEGAYLEPDVHFGAAYLNATGRALTGVTGSHAGMRIGLIGHDAFPGGAQHLLLSIGRALRRNFGAAVEYVLLAEGDMLAAYRNDALTTVCDSDEKLAAKLAAMAAVGFSSVIVNTSAAARTVAFARAAGLRTVFLVHEMARIIAERHFGEAVRSAVSHADATVFAADAVRDELLHAIGCETTPRVHIRAQGCYQDIVYDPAAGAAFRAELGISAGDVLVLGAGYADLRKGFDLFLQAWRCSQDKPQAGRRQSRGRIVYAWVGGIDPGLRSWLAKEIEAATATGTFIMAGYRRDMPAAFSAADAFALTSREDPLPTVVMEAMAAGLPTFAFEGSGGIPGMMAQLGEGRAVPYGDAPAMAAAIREASRTPITPAERARRRAAVQAHFDFRTYASFLLNLALPNACAVSVAVPNYNYARYMAQRLGSIFAQSHPVAEVLVLDDASTDGSAAEIVRVAAAHDRVIAFHPNARNSGSVFAQWRRAALIATGEFIWIAEADDASDSIFLARTLALMARDPAICLCFSDSRTVDTDGSPQWDSYKSYYGSDEPGALVRTQVFDGPDFVARYLATRNLILNGSAVVWRRAALLAALEACGEELFQLKVAGDWRLYIAALARPGAKLAYEAEPLNVHRRHTQSVTHALDVARHVAEIRSCQCQVRVLLGLDEAARERQDRYAREVERDLRASLQDTADIPVSASPHRPVARRKPKVQAATSRTASL